MIWAEGGNTVSDWAQVFGPIVNLGFAALVGWYLLTKALPKMQAEFADSLKEQRETYEKSLREERASREATVKEQRETFLTTTKEQVTNFNQREDLRRESEERQRQEFKSAMETITNHCERESLRRDASFKEEMGLVTKGLNDVGEILEELRTLLISLHSKGGIVENQKQKPREVK